MGKEHNASTPSPFTYLLRESDLSTNTAPRFVIGQKTPEHLTENKKTPGVGSYNLGLSTKLTEPRFSFPNDIRFKERPISTPGPQYYSPKPLAQKKA